MAARSDFYTAKLPRQLKKLIALAEINGYIDNSHDRGFVKKKFIEAHANHVAFKMKRAEMRDLGGSDEG
jgi:hypothetical protein